MIKAGDGSSRSFWSWGTLHNIASAIVVLAGGAFALLQFFSSRSIEVQRPFLEKQLELYVEVMNAAATIADPPDEHQKELALANFKRLYWGPMAAVEDQDVEDAMVRFYHCMNGTKCIDWDNNK